MLLLKQTGLLVFVKIPTSFFVSEGLLPIDSYRGQDFPFKSLFSATNPMKFILQLLLVSVLAATITPSFATIFYSKNEAMELAFGKGTPVETLSLFPDDEQIAKIQALAKTKLESGLFSFYVSKTQDKINRYVAIETNNVRTKPETLMIVLSADGQLQDVVTLAFHEPPEYQPPEHWYSSLFKRPLAAMDFSQGVDGISGATLSTRSALTSIRKVMAMYEIMIKPQESH